VAPDLLQVAMAPLVRLKDMGVRVSLVVFTQYYKFTPQKKGAESLMILNQVVIF